MDDIICREIFERYPFGVIFSKTAPSDLDSIDYDKDFCYYYFSPGFEKRCLLKRASMCDGVTNAKRDFPDYIAYFEDDAKVMRHFTDGKVYAFCEPWSPPGISTHVYTRKTAMNALTGAYMLGCFDIVDDIVLGITSFKLVPHSASAALPELGQPGSPIADEWFSVAFDKFPDAMAVFNAGGEVVMENKHWKLAMRSDIESFSLEPITQLFRLHGYERLPANLMNSAAWVTGVTTGALESRHELPFDIGTYGIQLPDGDSYQVVMTRPSMKSVANPYWTAACATR